MQPAPPGTKLHRQGGVNIETIALVNQKGGVAKTTTAVNLGIGLVQAGKSVLLVDADPQGSLTSHLGHYPEDMPITISTLMQKVMGGEVTEPGEGIMHHSEGIDFIPANIDLSVLERDLWSAARPMTVLAAVVEPLRQKYDYILLDCGPSLGILTLNVLAAANSVLIPIQAEFQALRGSQQLLGTVFRVRNHVNPDLSVKGIVMTMADTRTRHQREAIRDVRETFAGKLRVFKTVIPRSIAAADASAAGKSIFGYEPRNKVAHAYKQLVQEVLTLENRAKQ
ncbi:ParA family protein [Ruminococcaceae bacterium OttesenSCG-928-D13]|nr:ParA family protein [Ruminococcaceae bacterium OttesenSCG-928-D13]